MQRIYDFIVKGNQKAIVGFVLAFVGGLAIQVGGVNVLDVTVNEAIQAGVVGAINAAGVWFKANK